MAATLAGVSFSTATTVVAKAGGSSTKTLSPPCLNQPWRMNQVRGVRMVTIRTMATPDSLSDKVQESVANAQEVCAGDPVSGECVAAWDEVEEISAAASHKRDREKNADPLETYCKDNPETDECRTYDN
ncbi:hypothetical protein MKX01_025310 [Papaver californicum]|nr:hypothetical protein MKX01_025310 [Papaver californicum]